MNKHYYCNDCHFPVGERHNPTHDIEVNEIPKYGAREYFEDTKVRDLKVELKFWDVATERELIEFIKASQVIAPPTEEEKRRTEQWEAERLEFQRSLPISKRFKNKITL